MSFLYPIFLSALAVLAIPIIIHLFHFRRYKTILFSNVSFLKEVDTERKNQNRLKHLLVLAMRCMAFACLVLAFAITSSLTNNFALPWVPAGIVAREVWSPSPTSSLREFNINWSIISLSKPASYLKSKSKNILIESWFMDHSSWKKMKHGPEWGCSFDRVRGWWIIVHGKKWNMGRNGGVLLIEFMVDGS